MGSLNFNYFNSIKCRKKRAAFEIEHVFDNRISFEWSWSKQNRNFIEKWMAQKHLTSNKDNWRQFIQIDSMLYEVL